MSSIGRAAPSKSDLVDAVAAATLAAVTELFREHPRDHFYYCSLVTTGEALPPILVAWSWEALAAAASRCQDDPNARANLKWSYADSPFCDYGSEHFREVRLLFDARGALDPFAPEAWQAEYTLRLSAMEEALARLDRSGLFGTGRQRAAIVINVECMPPDHTNVQRALRLNPPEALTEWLEEAAEPAAPWRPRRSGAASTTPTRPAPAAGQELQRALERVRTGEGRAAVDDLESVLVEIYESRSEEALDVLCSALEDDFPYPGPMWTVLRTIERHAAHKRIARLLELTDDLLRRAPHWAETLYVRIFLNPRSRGELLQQLPSCTPATRSALMKLMERLENDPGPRSVEILNSVASVRRILGDLR